MKSDMMAGARIGLVMVLLLFAAVLPSRAQQAPSASAETATSPQLVLYPGDVVELRVFREEDISGQYLVDQRGTVVLPMLGRVPVTDAPLDEVRERLLAQYANYLRNPSVDVVFLRRVTVLGAVRTPGLYRVDPTMSVADVIALAGGPSPEGQSDRVHVVRDGHRMETRITQGSIAEIGLRSGDQLYVPERHWSSRNPAVTVSLLSGGISLAVALLLR
jgi:protein involved in polysaccharide export with SLBB domain